MDVDLIRDKSLVKNGDTINYTVEVDNLGTLACDVSNITIRLQFPGSNGAPSATFQTLVNAANYPAQMPVITFGPFPYTVNADPGVKRLEARVSVENGALHDGDTHSAVNINKTIGSDIPQPAIEVDKTANIKSGLAPQNVTYSFKVYNRTVPARELENITLTDDKCPGAGTQARPVPGDANGDNKLQPLEVWEFTCTMTHGVGVFTNVAEACGELILNGGPMPKVCDTDDETVEFTPPPSNPPSSPPPPPSNPPAETAVKPANATQAPCTLSTPKGLTVRAGEVTSIKATVRQVDAGTTVKITLPGGKSVSAKTNSKGVATLKVKPTKTGTARITVAECSDVQRLTVRAARKTQSKRVPRVTG